MHRSRRSRGLGWVLAGALVLGAGPAAAERYGAALVLEDGAADLRLHSLARDGNADLFDMDLPAKGTTYAGYFNGQQPPRSISDVSTEPDGNPDLLTQTELEAGVHGWWGDGDGDSPSDEELAEFDEVVGNLMRRRVYSLVNPVSAAMLADGHDWATVRRALVYTSSPDLPYQGMVFGAGAVEAGMTLSRAVEHVATTLGVDRNTAKGYLAGPSGSGYGSVDLEFFFQRKPPEDTETNRGDVEDDALYERVVATVPDFRPVQGSALNPDLHPGLQDHRPFPEPFDPGTGAVQNPDMVQYYAMEVVTRFTDAAGTAHEGGNEFYVENYRQVTQFDANFTGAMADGQVPNGTPVGDGLLTQASIPPDPQQGEFSLGDSAQQQAAFRATMEYGDALNAYTKLCSRQHGTCAMLYWVPPTRLPPGETTRFGTPILGPGFQTKGEDRSIVEEVAEDMDQLTLMEPPASMRPWLEELVFDETSGHVRRVEQVEDRIQAKWEEEGPDAFNGYAPYTLNANKNGHYRSLDLKVDQEQTTDPQTAEILRPYDFAVGPNFAEEAPTKLLYRLAFEDLTPEQEEALPQDTKGNTVVPSGGNLLIEAQTCCGVSSIVGGSSVKRNDDFPPGAQISAVSGDGVEGAGLMERRAAVTATVPNTPQAAGNPVGDYHLLYPMSRLHPDLPPLPEVGGDGRATGVQGQDAKFYGDYVNASPMWVHAPSHPDYQEEAFRPGTVANPVDREGAPFMALNGVATRDRQHPNYQDFRQGHRYDVTLVAYDNMPPLIVPPDPEYVARGFDPEGMLCYPISHFEYRLFRLDEDDEEVTVTEGVVVDGADYGPGDCVTQEPLVEIPWIPHADGPHFWSLRVVDTAGKERTLLSEVWVTGEKVGYDLLEQETSRQD